MIIPEMNKKEYRKFGLVMALFIGLIFGLVLPLIFKKIFPIFPWIISLFLFLWAMVAPGTMSVLYKVWMRLAFFVGKINTTIILGIVFFGIFTPIALIFKVFGRDVMNRKIKVDPSSSYWGKSTHQPKNHMENIY